MVTTYTTLGLTEPTKFLGATVLSFNSTLGLGSSVSTLTVTLIEDCTTDPVEVFYGNLPNDDPNKVVVGDPVFFTLGTFTFGGIISSWDVKLDPSGRIFTVRINDPRELLQNTEIIFESFVEGPYVAPNYANVYKYYLYFNEQPICNNFPIPNNTDEGIPYNNIMNGLAEMQDSDDPALGPFVYSPTYGATLNPTSKFRVDFTTFPGGANSLFYTGFPQFYRLQGPSAPLSEILESATDVAGYEYYVYLEQGDPGNNMPHTIKIGLIDLQNPPSDFSQVQAYIDSMVGEAFDISYGQELRNEKTKNMIIGDKVQYMANTTTFLPYFGQEYQNGNMKLVIPYGWDDFGFWINKSTDTLIDSLSTGQALAGVFQISELDIRMAMSGFKTWFFWVYITQAAGSLNDAVRQLYPLNRFPNTDQLIQAIANNPQAVNALGYWINNVTGIANSARMAADFGNNPGRASTGVHVPQIMQDLEKIQGWLFNLGNEYYGKKYLSSFNEGICYYLTDYTVYDPNQDGDPIFSSTPTTSAWAEPGIPILGLNDPYLEIFRDEEGKLKAFAGFRTDGIITP